MSVNEAPAIQEEQAQAQEPTQRTMEEIRIDHLERMLVQLKTELQNCKINIENQVSLSQNLSLLIELSNKELSDLLIKQSLQ